MQERVCSVDGCGRGGKLTRGMCTKDYRYWLDHTPKEKRGLPPRASRRFEDFVKHGARGRCWPWTGPVDAGGYGRWGKKLAHRVSYAMANGPIPEGASVLHRCDNPPCVNPKHLYAGTASDNMRDALARGLHPGTPIKNTTHCRNGHELVGRNLELVGKDKVRRCRRCDNDSSAERQRKKRLERGLLKTKVSADERARIFNLHVDGMSYRSIAMTVGRAVCTVGLIVREGPVGPAS